ncbi:MAG: transcription elongation GreA/GreB family factor [Saprospiraceae bacterium]|jgi:transcription elongation GreA/GreB family factor
MSDPIAIKKSLLFQCAELMQEKVDVLEKMTSDMQDSANNETKSSAGDKFETGRAMMHMERDKYARQLAQAVLVRDQLERIDPEKIFDHVTFGAIVKTKLANYFIAISAGRIEVEGEKFYVISPQAPLAQEILQKKAGDTFVFNDQEVKVLEVF